jgi:regulator of replication initiation timing
MLDMQIKKLAKVLLNQTDNLPDTPGLYFAVDAANRVWYIGKSESSLRASHEQHERLNDFITNRVDKIAYLAWNDMDDINEWEKELIAKFNPPLNDLFAPEDLPIVELGYDKEKYLLRYKEIRLMIDTLSKELEELKPNLVTLIEENEGKIKTPSFNAYLGKRTTYNYSEAVESLEAKIKVLKKDEEKNGVATVKNFSVFPIVR